MTISKLSKNQRLLQYSPIPFRFSEKPMFLPLLGSIKAGYPSLADDSVSFLNLEQYLIKDPRSSFLLRIEGDTVAELGITNGDLVIIEKAREAKVGDLVLALENKRWTIKRYESTAQISRLPSTGGLKISLKNDSEVYGVVSGVIRKL